MRKRVTPPAPNDPDALRDTFGAFIAIPEGGEAQRCYYPLRVDVYGRGCPHDCVYCYAKSLLEFRKYWNPEAPAIADMKKVRRTLLDHFEKGRRGPWSEYFDRRWPVRIGGMTDCFGVNEADGRAAFELLRILEEYNYPYLIVTKGTQLTKPEYLERLHPDLATVQVTITTLGENFKLIEPGAPPAASRLRVVQCLAEAGIWTQGRISPLIAGQGYYTEELTEAICEAGAGGIIAEFLRVPAGVAADLAQVIDLAEYTQTDGSTRHLPLAVKRKVLTAMKAITDAHGAELSVCEDMHYHELAPFRGDPDDCCNIRRHVAGYAPAGRRPEIRVLPNA